MKKIVTIIMTLIISIGLFVGCVSEEENKAQQQKTIERLNTAREKLSKGIPLTDAERRELEGYDNFIKRQYNTNSK